MTIARIRIPANDWRPREHQLNLWGYLEHGGTRAMAVWHRRSGKDEIALNYTCVAAHKRVGNYWHMLPEAKQARKAIWDAINPTTGKRRIDEAFPLELRKKTVDHEMKIELKCGSIWQVLGSDNYNSLVGTPPIGVTYSEWALADPRAWAYIRPILLENGGWALFITTPRGRNHAHRLAQLAREEEGWFYEHLTNDDTGIFSAAQLATEKREIIAEWGEEDGLAIYEQEYFCSFDAALVGSYYGSLIAKIEKAGQIRRVPHDPERLVFTAWDIGRTDDTSIWFYQLAPGEIHVIDFLTANNQDVPFYAERLRGRKIEILERNLSTGAIVRFALGERIEGHEHRAAYRYGTHWLPHDAKPKTFAANSRSALDQLEELKIGELNIVPMLSVQDGIMASRKTLPLCYFDAKRCEHGVDALRQYRRSRNDETRSFSVNPLHDWTSNPADAWRMLSVAWFVARAPEKKVTPQEQLKQVIARQSKQLTYADIEKMHDERNASRRQRV